MRRVEPRIRAIAYTERRKPQSPEKARLQSTAQQGLPKPTSVLRHFSLAGSGDAEDDEGVLDEIFELDRVQIENRRVEAETLRESANLFGDILSVSCFGAVKNKSRACSVVCQPCMSLHNASYDCVGVDSGLRRPLQISLPLPDSKSGAFRVSCIPFSTASTCGDHAGEAFPCY